MSDPMKAPQVWPKFAAALGLLSAARCPNRDCDGHGVITKCDSEGQVEMEQCRWCDERNTVLAGYQSREPG